MKTFDYLILAFLMTAANLHTWHLFQIERKIDALQLSIQTKESRP